MCSVTSLLAVLQRFLGFLYFSAMSKIKKKNKKRFTHDVNVRRTLTRPKRKTYRSSALAVMLAQARRRPSASSALATQAMLRSMQERSKFTAAEN